MRFCVDTQLRICSKFRSRYDNFPRDYFTRQINAVLWISLIAITAFLFRKLAKLLRLWTKGRIIPGPPCPSFFGHSQLISRSSSVTDLLSKSHERYGPIVKLWLGPTQLLVSLKDPELIKEMLINAKDKLPLSGWPFRLAFGRSSFFVSSFHKVERTRNVLAVKLNGKLLDKKNVFPSKVADYVMERIQNLIAARGVECEMVSQHLAFTLLGATLFGDAFLSSPRAAIYEELIMKVAKDACFWASFSVTPFWKKEFWRYQQLCMNLRSLTQGIIEECRQNNRLCCQVDPNTDKETHNLGQEAASSGLHCFGEKVLNNLCLWDLDSQESYGNIVSMMFHGSLTTAGLIGNILSRLVTHPEIQDEIHSLIIIARKHSQKPDQLEVDRIPLLVATIYESTRLLPAELLLQRCSLNHDLNLESGATIPAGAILVVPVQLVQMNDDSWGSDAGMFNPYRFLSKPKKESHLVDGTSFTEKHEPSEQGSYSLDDPTRNSAFLPFGSGARACVGQKLVILEVATLFASLLEQYEIRLQPGSEGNPKPVKNNCRLQFIPNPKIVFVRRNT